MGETSMNKMRVAEIRDEWSWVKEGVEAVHASLPVADWVPDDLFDRCNTGQAILFVSDEGFAVFMVVTNPLTLERTWFNWICWAKEGTGTGVIAKYFDYFCDLGRQLQCSRLSGETPFQKLGDMYVSFGFRLDMSKYSFDLGETKDES
jgi:hypothetical protein